jgi:hypothetical protein
LQLAKDNGLDQDRRRELKLVSVKMPHDEDSESVLKYKVCKQNTNAELLTTPFSVAWGRGHCGTN